jgi:uncharacterized membrane protein YgcG
LVDCRFTGCDGSVRDLRPATAIVDSISNFFSVNSGRFGVMVVMVVGAYIALRIFGIVFSEYRQHSKMHPLTLGLFENLVHYLVYAVVAVLLLTNLLVMAGLQTIAATLVTLFTVFIGLVVSFAATGSIGNALSGRGYGVASIQGGRSSGSRRSSLRRRA